MISTLELSPSLYVIGLVNDGASQGTQHVSEQVCHTYAIMKTLPVLMKQSVDGNENVREVLQKLVNGKKETRRAVRLAENLVALSKAKIRNLSEEERLPIT